jgi:hypothetical protein
MSAYELVRIPVVTDADVFALRHRGREVAGLLGFDEQDQVRIATALSEVGREVIAGAGSDAVLSLDPVHPVTLTVTVGGLDRVDPNPPGVSAARRLMDEVVAEDGQVVLVKYLPGTRFRGDLAALRERIAELAPASPLDELRTQNFELLTAMESLS